MDGGLAAARGLAESLLVAVVDDSDVDRAHSGDLICRALRSDDGADLLASTLEGPCDQPTAEVAVCTGHQDPGACHGRTIARLTSRPGALQCPCGPNLDAGLAPRPGSEPPLYSVAGASGSRGAAAHRPDAGWRCPRDPVPACLGRCRSGCRRPRGASRSRARPRICVRSGRYEPSRAGAHPGRLRGAHVRLPRPRSEPECLCPWLGLEGLTPRRYAIRRRLPEVFTGHRWVPHLGHGSLDGSRRGACVRGVR